MMRDVKINNIKTLDLISESYEDDEKTQLGQFTLSLPECCEIWEIHY